ncbi:MAG: BON domain-containing protein [Nitrospirota bacterium]
MRKSLLLKSCVVLVVAVFFAAGCATFTGKTAGQIASDTAITSKINAKIVQDPELAYLKIDVDTFEGNVTLSGQVPSAEARDRLVALAKATEGVKSVKQNLVIEPPKWPQQQQQQQQQ